MKKANFDHLNTVLIFLVVVVILPSIIFTMTKESDEAQNAQICAKSVDAQTRVLLSGDEFSSDLICPTSHHIITERNDEKVKKEIADYMTRCWKNFKEGEKELFNGEDYFCVVCDTIEFKDQKRDNIKEFASYLSTANPQGKTTTYAESFSHYSIDSNYALSEIERMGSEAHQKDFEIDPRKQYMVLFSYIKGKNNLEEWATRLDYTLESSGPTGIGLGIVKAGLAISKSVIGGKVGIPLIFIGGAISLGGLLWATIREAFNEAEPQWAAFIELKEYSTEALSECNYLPAKQRG